MVGTAVNANPYAVDSKRFEERYPVFAHYLTDTWRAFRTWGVSAISPWQHEHFWTLREGVDKSRKELSVDWENLQRPGFSPDYTAAQYERMDLAFERSDWIPTEAAQALIRNNRPLLAYLGGSPARFTSKDHNFSPGETVEKQIIVVNNSRQTVTCEAQWSFDLPQPVAGRRRLTVATGVQTRTPLRFELPARLAPGQYEIRLAARFSSGEIQEDRFAVDVLPIPHNLALAGKIALFDPRGDTATWLDRIGVRCQHVGAEADLSSFEILIVGKAAFTAGGAAPDINRVRAGLKVIVFEQTAEVLEKRFGFRVIEYGLRQLFPRVPDHPILAGISPGHLADWRGEATLIPPRLNYELRPRHGPTVQWCGIPVSRVWRCGNRGNVASVLIEKPARGNFLPVLDGGFSLQYSPLLEYREGQGMVLFCQLDVTTRTGSDPAAETLARNLLRYAADWKPPPRRREAAYAGDPAGRAHLEAAGLSVSAYNSGSLSPDQVLVVGKGGGKQLLPQAPAIAEWLKSGGSLLAIGLDQQDADALLPFKIELKKAEHISTFFQPFSINSALAGIGPADVHNRDPREVPLVASGAIPVGNGILARADGANAIFCQMAPWEFRSTNRPNLRRTHRRAAFLLTRLLANLGVANSTPLLDRFHSPVDASKGEQRWLDGFYLDQPEEWDDPYRFFRW